MIYPRPGLRAFESIGYGQCSGVENTMLHHQESMRVGKLEKKRSSGQEQFGGVFVLSGFPGHFGSLMDPTVQNPRVFHCDVKLL